MESLFFYGTLVDPDIFEAVLGRPLANARPVDAVLEGYRAVLVVGRPYPGLVAAPGARAEGILVSGITRQDMDILIRYEDRDMYGVEVKTVRTSDGKEHVTKVFMPKRRIRLSRRQWSLTDWQRRLKRDYLPKIPRFL